MARPAGSGRVRGADSQSGAIRPLCLAFVAWSDGLRSQRIFAISTEDVALTRPPAKPRTVPDMRCASTNDEPVAGHQCPHAHDPHVWVNVIAPDSRGLMNDLPGKIRSCRPMGRVSTTKGTAL